MKRDEALELLEFLEGLDRYLSMWEIDFVESLREQLKDPQRWGLSQKQGARLTEIFDRLSGG